jgi:hypothetical protein
MVTYPENGSVEGSTIGKPADHIGEEVIHPPAKATHALE